MWKRRNNEGQYHVQGVLPIIIIDHASRCLLQEAERLLPGSLTYRTYGYLMVAYAIENQWGAAIDLATVRGAFIVPFGVISCIV